VRVGEGGGCARRGRGSGRVAFFRAAAGTGKVEGEDVGEARSNGSTSAARLCGAGEGGAVIWRATHEGGGGGDVPRGMTKDKKNEVSLFL